MIGIQLQVWHHCPSAHAINVHKRTRHTTSTWSQCSRYRAWLYRKSSQKSTVLEKRKGWHRCDLCGLCFLLHLINVHLPCACVHKKGKKIVSVDKPSGMCHGIVAVQSVSREPHKPTPSHPMREETRAPTLANEISGNSFVSFSYSGAMALHGL